MPVFLVRGSYCCSLTKAAFISIQGTCRLQKSPININWLCKESEAQVLQNCSSVMSLQEDCTFIALGRVLWDRIALETLGTTSSSRDGGSIACLARTFPKMVIMALLMLRSVACVLSAQPVKHFLDSCACTPASNRDEETETQRTGVSCHLDPGVRSHTGARGCRVHSISGKGFSLSPGWIALYQGWVRSTGNQGCVTCSGKVTLCFL